MSDIGTYSENKLSLRWLRNLHNSSSYVLKAVLRALSLSFRFSSLAPPFIIRPAELTMAKTITFIVIDPTTTTGGVMPNNPNSKDNRFGLTARGTTIYIASFCRDKSGTTLQLQDFISPSTCLYVRLKSTTDYFPMHIMYVICTLRAFYNKIM